MTRNNLADNLSWLLSNTAFSKPLAQPFPCPSDPSSLQYSQPQSRRPSIEPRIRSATSSFTGDGTNGQADIRGVADGLAERGDVQHHHTNRATLEQHSMGRLTSSTKTKKTVLVSQKHQLPTPAATEDGRSTIRLNQETDVNGEHHNQLSYFTCGLIIRRFERQKACRKCNTVCIGLILSANVPEPEP